MVRRRGEDRRRDTQARRSDVRKVGREVAVGRAGEVDAGPTTVGPAGPPSGCVSNPSAVTITSAFVSWPFGDRFEDYIPLRDLDRFMEWRDRRREAGG
jgi:hypothetical protein